MAKTAVLELLEPLKLILRKNMSDKDWSEKNETGILVCSSGMPQPIFNYFTDLKSAQNFREIEY